MLGIIRKFEFLQFSKPWKITIKHIVKVDRKLALMYIKNLKKKANLWVDNSKNIVENLKQL